MPVPTQSAPGPRAPRPLRLKSASMATSLPPGAQLLVDALVGSFLGSSRAEVLRFMAVSWITDHHAAIKAIIESKKAKP